MYDVVIIGAGIAGLTSALYALRSNKKVLVLEKKSYGGQIINSLEVDNYPGFNKISGFELATNIYNQVKELGGEIKYEEVLEINKEKQVITNKNKYECKSIIIATGLIPRKLGLDNEDKFIGKGISYCATCDGNFYKDKDVVVVGGGNTALEDAIYLSNICNKVYLVHRRAEFRGNEEYRKIVESKDNIEIIYDSVITSINGDNLLESVGINNLITNDSKELLVSGLFVAIGNIPNNDIFKDLIDLDEYGYIISNDCYTNIEGVFVAGDTRVKNVRQLVTAASDGAIAATNTINYLNNKM